MHKRFLCCFFLIIGTMSLLFFHFRSFLRCLGLRLYFLLSTSHSENRESLYINQFATFLKQYGQQRYNEKCTILLPFRFAKLIDTIQSYVYISQCYMLFTTTNLIISFNNCNRSSINPCTISLSYFFHLPRNEIQNILQSYLDRQILYRKYPQNMLAEIWHTPHKKTRRIPVSIPGSI